MMPRFARFLRLSPRCLRSARCLRRGRVVNMFSHRQIEEK